MDNQKGVGEMIEFTVLGNYGPYATAQGACSGYLLNANGFQIMLDCGNGSLVSCRNTVITISWAF